MSIGWIFIRLDLIDIFYFSKQLYELTQEENYSYYFLFDELSYFNLNKEGYNNEITITISPYSSSLSVLKSLENKNLFLNNFCLHFILLRLRVLTSVYFIS